MTTVDPVTATLLFVERINAGDLDGLTELLTEDHRFIEDAGGMERGREKMRAGWAGYFAAYPDYRIHVHQVLRGGRGVAIVGTTTGSHLPPEVEKKGTVLWTAELRDGRVEEWRIYTSQENAHEARQEHDMPP